MRCDDDVHLIVSKDQRKIIHTISLNLNKTEQNTHRKHLNNQTCACMSHNHHHPTTATTANDLFVHFLLILFIFVSPIVTLFNVIFLVDDILQGLVT